MTLQIRTFAIIYTVRGISSFIVDPIPFIVGIAVGVVLAEIRRQILPFFLRLLRFLLCRDVVAEIAQGLAHFLQRISCCHLRD